MDICSAEIRRLLDAVSSAADTDAKGKGYEELAIYLFECVPGCATVRDTISVFRSEQIDVAVGNAQHPDGLPILPRAIIVECKAWSRPVDSCTVGYFINILTNRSAELGILIAANGITGDPAELTNAHALGPPALARGIKVLVIDTADVDRLTCTEDFTNLLTRRYLRAFASGGIGIGD